jgi:hypothetical protein
MNERQLANYAALLAVKKSHSNLIEAIADLYELTKSLPEGELRDKLFDQLSDFDSIADVMRQALDSIK